MGKYFLSFLLALTLHLGIIALSVFSLSKEATVSVKPKETSVIIEAMILDENIITAKAQELKQRQENKRHLQAKQQQKYARKLAQEKHQLQQLKKQRQQAERATKKQANQRKIAAQQEQKKLQAIKHNIALEQKKQQKILKQRQAEKQKWAIEKKRQAEAKRAAEAKRKAKKAKQQEIAKQRKIAAEKRRKALEKELRLQVDQEEKRNKQHAENAKIAEQAATKASNLIQHKIEQNWNRPSSIPKKLRCTISIELVPSGDVIKVKVVGSSGNPLFDRSAEQAVYKASPLPVPKDPNIFKKFRNFDLEFDPDKIK